MRPAVEEVITVSSRDEVVPGIPEEAVVSGLAREGVVAGTAESARRAAPEMDALVVGRMAIRHRAVREIVARVRDEGRLQAGWSIDDAAGFVWTLLSPAAYRLLVHERGWSGGRWTTRTKQLLADAFITGEPDDGDT